MRPLVRVLIQVTKLVQVYMPVLVLVLLDPARLGHTNVGHSTPCRGQIIWAACPVPSHPHPTKYVCFSLKPCSRHVPEPPDLWPHILWASHLLGPDFLNRALARAHVRVPIHRIPLLGITSCIRKNTRPDNGTSVPGLVRYSHDDAYDYEHKYWH